MVKARATAAWSTYNTATITVPFVQKAENASSLLKSVLTYCIIIPAWMTWSIWLCVHRPGCYFSIQFDDLWGNRQRDGKQKDGLYDIDDSSGVFICNT